MTTLNTITSYMSMTRSLAPEESAPPYRTLFTLRYFSVAPFFSFLASSFLMFQCLRILTKVSMVDL